MVGDSGAAAAAAAGRGGSTASATGAVPPPVVVDASVWIARYVPADRFHTVSAAWLRAQVRAGRTLISPSLLLPELAGNIARITNDTALGLRVARAVTRLSHVRLVPVDEALAVEALTLAATLRLKGGDAVYTAVARRLRIQLVSWDNEHVLRAGAVNPLLPLAPTRAR